LIYCQRLAFPAAGEKKAWKRKTAKAQEKAQKTRRIPAVGCTSAGWLHPISPKKQGRLESILPKWQTNKPYVSLGELRSLPWCTVVSGHDDLSTGGVKNDPDYA